MTLSCSCDTDGDFAWYYEPPRDYSTLESKRRKRCSSCNDLIDIGSTIARFLVYRPVKTFVEERIFGDDGEVYLADKILCEKCADLYFSFDDLGFSCVAPDENMIELAREYSQVYLKNRA